MTEAKMGDDPDRLLHTLREAFRAEICSDQPDLNLRQLAVLLVVYSTDELQTVRGLAAYLHIHKSAVGRALNRFKETDVAYREVDLQDRRSVFVGRTVRGAAMVEGLGTAMVEAANRLGEAP